MRYWMVDININKAILFEIGCNDFYCTNNCFGDCLVTEDSPKCTIWEKKCMI